MVGNKCKNSHHHHHHPLSLRYVIISHACVRDSQSKCSLWGCNSGCLGQQAWRIAWMNRGDTLVTTRRHEAGGSTLTLTCSLSGSLLSYHMTIGCHSSDCRQRIKLWARFSECKGLCNNAAGPRRWMGANASCVQLKIDGILELRLVVSSHVLIWMVNRL